MRNEASSPPNFDRLARPYRWLEYLTFGTALKRCRLHFLPQLGDRRHALVLGDGDGRFLARLLTHNADLRADAVDLSPTMLHLLRRRAIAAAPTTASARLTTHSADALSFQPAGPYDLVVTHFFLDCLTTAHLNQLVYRLTPQLTPDALWLVSDFRVPRRGLLRLAGSMLVRLLYLAFRLLTGLRTSRLPEHAPALLHAGFLPIARHLSLGGLLTTELWQHHPSSSLRHQTAQSLT